MKVIYRDPDGGAGTFHPKLGYLESGKVFELPGEIAGRYIESGLLTKFKKQEPKQEQGGKTQWEHR